MPTRMRAAAHGDDKFRINLKQLKCKEPSEMCTETPKGQTETPTPPLL